ncbi:hypothetical protein CYY_002548 [Polysphondylium violaceum]|uniref:Right handed beta helix domain-containing protein n=1 Tax=Polysphondylium violaceum TaxID=133409 RepID=A0A8J4UV14_9MYCE|nr:hypothetical protein CYY_002548 [Polysphondylium violaceum]
MWKTKSILFIVLVNLVCLLTASESITYYVDPSSVENKKDCGADITTACPSISFAVQSFLNNGSFDSSCLLTIELVAGDYYPSNTTYDESQPIPLFGLNVVIQPYKNQQVVISGENLIGDGPFFSYDDQNNGNRPTSSLLIKDIAFDQFKLPIINADVPSPLNIAFENVQITDSASMTAYPNQLFVLFSSTENQTTLSFTDCVFEGNANILLSNGGYVTFTTCQIKTNIGTSPFLSFSYYYEELPNTLVFNNCSIEKNSGSSHGIVYSMGGKVGFKNSLVKKNSAYATLVFYNANVDITGTSFYENTGTSNGAILVQNSTLNLNDCVFSQNSGKVGASIYSTSNLNITNTSFNENYANQGMAIYQTTNSGQDQRIVNIESSSFVSMYDSSTFSNQNMFYFSNAMVLLKDSSINIGTSRVSNGFVMIDCSSSSIKYVDTNVTSFNNYPPMSCSSCTVSNSNQESANIECPSSSSSTPNSNSTDDSSHSENHNSSQSNENHSGSQNNNNNDSNSNDNHHDSNENHHPSTKRSTFILESVLIPMGCVLVISSVFYIIIIHRRRNRGYQPIN